MEKQKKQLIILGIFLVLVIAVYAGLKYYNANQTKEETITYPVTQVMAEEVTQIAFTNENGSFTYIKSDDGWYCAEDENAQIDDELLTDSIGDIVETVSEDRIDNVEDMSQYGLREPGIKVVYSTAAGSTTLLMGDYNSAISKYYIAIDGENTVYTADGSLYYSLTKSLEDFRMAETKEAEGTGVTETEETKTEAAGTEETGAEKAETEEVVEIE